MGICEKYGMYAFLWASEKRLARHGDFGVSKLVVSMYLHAYFHAFVGGFRPGRVPESFF